MNKEGDSAESKEALLLGTGCHITVLPGNPTKAFLEGDDWDVVSLLALMTMTMMTCGVECSVPTQR